MSSTGALPIWITILQGDGREVAREEMLAYWESKGKLKTHEIQITVAAGTGATYVVTSGKDGYLVGAGFNYNDGGTGTFSIELRVDTVVKQTFRKTANALNFVANFENLGYKIDGDGAKSFDIELVSSGVNGVLESWI